MIVGSITEDGEPLISLTVAGRDCEAVVDTGFNGDLELPVELFSVLPHEYLGRTISTLAGAQQIEEDSYEIDFPFDGKIMRTAVTFAPGRQILIGTHLMRQHRLEINFPARTLKLWRFE